MTTQSTEQRLKSLLSSLEESIRTTPPNAPHLILAMQVKQLAEIVEQMRRERDDLPVYNIPQVD